MNRRTWATAALLVVAATALILGWATPEGDTCGQYGPPGDEIALWTSLVDGALAILLALVGWWFLVRQWRVPTTRRRNAVLLALCFAALVCDWFAFVTSLDFCLTF